MRVRWRLPTQATRGGRKDYLMIWPGGFPKIPSCVFNYVPTLSARLSIVRSGPQRALDYLQVGAPYELGLPSLSFHNWPIFVRGEAYLASRRGREAATEFQKIVDHRAIALNEPIGALAHLQLGRAYALEGDMTKAHAAYQDCLTLWKDADPDIPIFLQAKAEFAKVR